MAWQCIFHDIPWHFMKFIATFAACQWMSVDIHGVLFDVILFQEKGRKLSQAGGSYRWSYHDLSKCVQKCFSAILFKYLMGFNGKGDLYNRISSNLLSHVQSQSSTRIPTLSLLSLYRRMLRRLRRLLQWCWSSWWTVTAHSCVHKKHWRLVEAGHGWSRLFIT